ncbi:hypothetical protein D0T12_21370 [Actinomadura spongiicola]|uniref:Uncharacterized protein n=1 Tax=Actinomadura spongiicola TaxID=2303421 RepID=A0A372GEF7_9ACTN|nr:hypothetical protein D0T12_21370 [Actinomadura spongiicola]
MAAADASVACWGGAAAAGAAGTTAVMSDAPSAVVVVRTRPRVVMPGFRRFRGVCRMTPDLAGDAYRAAVTHGMFVRGFGRRDRLVSRRA